MVRYNTVLIRLLCYIAIKLVQLRKCCENSHSTYYVTAVVNNHESRINDVSNLSIFEHFCHPIFAHNSIKKAAEAAVFDI